MMVGMGFRFSLRELLFALSLLAIGLALFMSMQGANDRSALIALPFSFCAFGAAIGIFVRHPWIAAFLSFAIGALFAGYFWSASHG